jgi:hypothetical protein
MQGWGMRRLQYENLPVGILGFAQAPGLLVLQRMVESLLDCQLGHAINSLWAALQWLSTGASDTRGDGKHVAFYRPRGLQTEAAAQIEQMARQGDWSRMREIVGRLETELDKLMPALQALEK